MTNIEPEYAEAFDAWKLAPSKDNTGTLLKTVDPVLSNAIRSYATGMLRSPTIKSKARLLAVDAFHSYDPGRGSLRSHLLSRLQRLRRLAAGERQVIRMPEQVAIDQMRTNEATAEMEDKLGRPPSDQELADTTGLSFKRLPHIRQGLRPVAEGTITQPGTAEGTGQFDPATQSLTPDYEQWLEFLYGDMDATNQFIMERTFGMRGHTPMPPKQIAQQLRLTPGAISHRMGRIQQQIDELAAMGGL